MSSEKFETVLESLGVIARLTENKRLSIRTGHVDIETDQKFQFFIRWWYSDDRENCLDRVKSLVADCISMAETELTEIMANRPELEKSKHIRRFGRLTKALEQASHGIETQKTTYKHDDRFCVLIDVLIGKIRDSLTQMQLTLKMATPSEAPSVVTHHVGSSDDESDMEINF